MWDGGGGSKPRMKDVTHTSHWGNINIQVSRLITGGTKILRPLVYAKWRKDPRRKLEDGKGRR